MSARRTWTSASGLIRRVMRDPGMVVMLVLVPIVGALVFGLADQRANDALLIGVVRPNGPIASDLVAQLGHEPEVFVRTYSSADRLQRAVRRGDVQAGLIVPSAYDAQVGTTTAPQLSLVGDSRESTFVGAQAIVLIVADREALVASYARRHPAAQSSLAARLPAARAALGATAVASTKETAHGLTSVSGLRRSVAGMLVFFVFAVSMGYATLLVGDRRRGMITRAAMTHATEREIVAGEIGGRFLISAAQGLAIVVISALLLGVRWGDPLGVACVVVLFAIASASIAVVVGCYLGGSREQAVFVTDGLMAVLGVPGGCFFALTLLPAWVRMVGHLAPHAWAVDAFNDLLGTNRGVSAIWTELAVLALFAALSFWAGARQLRRSLGA
jgi:ABC-2 type transport system permease protein